MAIVEFDAAAGIGEHFGDHAFELEHLFFGHQVSLALSAYVIGRSFYRTSSIAAYLIGNGEQMRSAPRAEV